MKKFQLAPGMEEMSPSEQMACYGGIWDKAIKWAITAAIEFFYEVIKNPQEHKQAFLEGFADGSTAGSW